MKNKQEKIIHAPILSLSAKIELFAKFLRKATYTTSSPQKNLQATSAETPTKQTVKQIASKKIQTSSLPMRKKKSA